MKTFMFIVGIICAAGVWLVSCTNPRTQGAENYLDSLGDLGSATVFAPTLALAGNTFKGSFSKEGNTFYFFRNVTLNQEDYRIYVSNFSQGKWSSPKEISFSNGASDLYPLVLPTGDRMLFVSYRPTGDTGIAPNANFWMSTLQDGDWGTPSLVKDASILTNYDSQPSVSGNGTLFFTTDLPGWTQTLTMISDYDDAGEYQSPRPFNAINTFREEMQDVQIYEVCMAPDESYMVLTISEREEGGSFLAADLFISYREGRTWSKPQKLLKGNINTEETENFPYISPDGEYLFFTRGFSQFYHISTSAFVHASP